MVERRPAGRDHFALRQRRQQCAARLQLSRQHRRLLSRRKTLPQHPAQRDAELRHLLPLLCLGVRKVAAGDHSRVGCL